MFKRLSHWLYQSRLMRFIQHLAQKVYVSRKANLNLLTAYYFVREEIQETNIFAEAKAVSYNFTLAVFPAIIFLFTLVPYFEVVGIQREEILIFFNDSIPTNLYESLENTIIDLVDNKREELTLFGFLFATFMSTNGMLALIASFNRCYKTAERRSRIKQHFIAFVLMILIMFVLLTAMILIVFGGLIIESIQERFHLIEGLELARFLQYSVFFLFYFVVISIIYVIAPTVPKRWKFFSIGAVFATLMSIILSTVFSYYVNNFATYNKVYGSIGTLIAFMIWLQWMSITLLLGFEINVGIERAKQTIKKVKGI